MPRRFSRSPRRVANRGRVLAGSSITLVVVLLFTACTAGPSTRPAIVQQHQPSGQQQQQTRSDDPRSLPPLRQAPENSIDWRDCDSDTRQRLGEHSDVPDELHFSCAGIMTGTGKPDEPGSSIKRIHVLRAGTGDVPLLVLNDVGGAPGSLYAARLAARMPDDLLEKFSFLGVDRRGTGKSDPINCIPDKARAKLLGHDPADDDISTLLDAARTAGQRCAIALRGTQGSYDSTHTARDLDELRRSLGVQHLNAMSRGESSRVLLSYAQQYPQHVGRFVFNGIPDPSPELRTMFGSMTDGAAAALQAFGEDCENGNDCPLDGDARTAVQNLVDQLRDSPERTEAGTSMGPALALYAVRRGLGQPQRWDELASAIAEASDGEPDKLAGFIEPVVEGTKKQPPRLDATIATTCNDTTTRPPVERINTLLDDLQDEHSLFGGLAAQRLVWCNPWAPRDEPIDPGDVSNVPPMLVTTSAADPTVPEKATQRSASRLPNAALVRWQGAGHGALRSDCVVEAVHDFLLEDVVPTQGTLCPA